MVKEQEEDGTVWSPSKVIARLGKEINNEESVYYWCHKNDIPVFCPALTDGSLGDMIYFHTYKTEHQLKIDIVSDIRRLNDLSVKSKKAGMIILGGGVCKHQIANAMLFVGRVIDSRLNLAKRGRLCSVHQHGSRIRRVRLRCET